MSTCLPNTSPPPEKPAHALTGVVLALLTLFCGLASAQVPSNTESEQRSQAESRRQQQREQEQRLRLEAGADVRLDKGAAAPTPRLPRDESPCFRIDQIELLGSDLQRFDWLPAALAGRNGDDSLSVANKICSRQRG